MSKFEIRFTVIEDTTNLQVEDIYTKKSPEHFHDSIEKPSEEKKEEDSDEKDG